MIPFINLREIDKKRLRNLKDRAETNLKSEDIWFVHTVLAQCFLPYHDPKTERWHKKNGAFSILLTAGAIEDKESFRILGLPFGAKPRLFQSYMCTQAIKHQSPVIPVEPSMTAMLVELGYDPKGGPRGNIASFKEQITRFARCHFTLVGPGPLEGMRRYIETTPINRWC
jgi:Plasmid encoded RepA protein